MNVQAADHVNSAQVIAKLTKVDATEARNAAAVETKDAAAPVNQEPAETAPLDDQNKAKGKGVLRLLQAGHFKGVADVRLRINFFEQLSAQATADAASAVHTHAPDLVDAVNAQVNELIAPLTTDEESPQTVGALQDEFDAAVQGATDQFASDKGVNTEALSDAFQSAFGALVDGLRGLLSAPAEPSPPETDNDASAVSAVADAAQQVADLREEAELLTRPLTAEPIAHDELLEAQAPESPDEVVLEPPAESGVVDPNATLEAALASLTETFDKLLANLLGSARTALQLPDPSEPPGHGRAYDKFLAIYNQLRGLTPEVNELG